MTKEEKEQKQTKLLQLLSSPDEANVQLALTMAGGLSAEVLGEAWRNKMKGYQELHQVFGKETWDNGQATNHIAALNQASLQVNHKGLKTLPRSIGNLQNLRDLHLWDNQLTHLPENIGKLQYLQKLNLNWNRLTSLPESISKLQNLQTLKLGDNRLTHLPESIRELQNLQDLHLWDNQLTSLPESIGELQNLRELSLKNNQLTSLPKSITNLKNLKTLWFRGNPDLTITADQREWLKTIHGLYLLDVDLDKIPVRKKQVFSFDELKLDNKSRNTRI